ncbi:MAG: flagellar assembly protein FliW [Lachnospiraceae bacterium]|nr:flagellar assembly protein FliW [Lachnospiraceae bacterium]
MKVQTKIFGEIDIEDEKIIEFPGGIIGFPEMKRFTLLFDEEKKPASIHWLQSLDEPAFAMPVINPLILKEDYNPQVDDDVLKDIQPFDAENLLVLVTMTIPHDLKEMTINLRGPILINSDTRKGAQIIVDDEACPVKFKIYDILEERKKQAEAEEKK